MDLPNTIKNNKGITNQIKPTGDEINNIVIRGEKVLPETAKKFKIIFISSPICKTEKIREKGMDLKCLPSAEVLKA